jgi:hypothetical protein
MEVLNQLLSNQADYLNALRHAQQMLVAPPPDPGNGPKFNFNGKLIARILMAAGILYVGYQIYRSLTREPLDEEE